MKEFFDYFTKENINKIALTLLFIDLIDVVYSIIGGI